jgi:galacturonosyltransferase
MKILILANNDVGLYQFRRELIESLLQNHQVTISLPWGELVAPLQELGCHFVDTPIDRRGINPVTDWKLMRHYRKLLKEVEPDLVITYTIKPNIYGGLACRKVKIPYAINITGLGTAFQKEGLLRTLVKTLYRSALKKAKVVFFENSTNRQLFVDEKIVPEAKCCLLHGAGVNLTHYAPVPYPQTTPIRFLFVGRVMQEKGIGELFEAMERLHSEGENCCLDVLGLHEEDYAQRIDLGVKAGWLCYHGYQKDVRPFIEQAHCFTLPSYHEGMANTNLECAAMGRPLITSDIPGCREAVTTGSGILCKPQSTDSLYKAMKTFLCLTPEAQAAMGQAGRAHMEEVFDKKKVVRATMDALDL